MRFFRFFFNFPSNFVISMNWFSLFRSRLCNFLLILGRFCCFALQKAWTKEFKHTLESLLDGGDGQVKDVKLQFFSFFIFHFHFKLLNQISTKCDVFFSNFRPPRMQSKSSANCLFIIYKIKHNRVQKISSKFSIGKSKSCKCI